MNNDISQTVKRLNSTHLYIIAALIILLLAVMFGLLKLPAIGEEASIIAERYAIGLTLIAIPGALKLFSNKIKKLTESETDAGIKIKQFSSAFNLRIAILGVMGLANTLFYAITANSNFMWLAVILFLAFVFCRTSEAELSAVISTKDKTEEEAEDE